MIDTAPYFIVLSLASEEWRDPMAWEFTMEHWLSIVGDRDAATYNVSVSGQTWLGLQVNLFESVDGGDIALIAGPANEPMLFGEPHDRKTSTAERIAKLGVKRFPIRLAPIAIASVSHG